MKSNTHGLLLVGVFQIKILLTGQIELLHCFWGEIKAVI